MTWTDEMNDWELDMDKARKRWKRFVDWLKNIG